MRTLKRREQIIKILAPTVTTGALGSKVITWTGTPTNVNADVQPVSSSRQIAEYGTRVDNMMLAIVSIDTTAEIGYGVWLASESTAVPPWMIVSKSAWSTHIELTIEKKV